MKKFLCIVLSILMCILVCSCFGGEKKTKKYNAKEDMIKKYTAIVKDYQNENGEMSLLDYMVQNKALGGVCFLDLVDFDNNGFDELVIAWFDSFDSNGFANYNFEVFQFDKNAKKAESVFKSERVLQSQLSYDNYKNKPYSAVKMVNIDSKRYVEIGDGLDNACEFYGLKDGKFTKAISFLQIDENFFINNKKVSEKEYYDKFDKWSAGDFSPEEYTLSPIKFDGSKVFDIVQATIDVTNETLAILSLPASSVSFNNSTENVEETTTTTTEPTTITTQPTTQAVTDDTRGAIEYTGEYITYYGKTASDTAPCYGVNIKSVESGYITFDVYNSGKNGSPYYATDEISARLKNDKASFNWKDSWGNKGKGTITISKSIVTINMKETKTAKDNRSSLNTNGDLKLYKK